jgi:hypothetical protein
MTGFLDKLLKSRPKGTVTIVSGLPRSGTSMMMKMLEAGGIPPLTDEIRAADSDNPKGYYEFERVKKLDKGDRGWLEEAEGKVVKVISALLKHLPRDFTYKVIFMRRDMQEILASQRRMLIRRGESTDKDSDHEIGELLSRHVSEVETWMNEQPNIEVIYVSYNRMLENPVEEVERVDRFLGRMLDIEEMLAVVDPKLYRQRVEERNAAWSP